VGSWKLHKGVKTKAAASVHAAALAGTGPGELFFMLHLGFFLGYLVFQGVHQLVHAGGKIEVRFLNMGTCTPPEIHRAFTFELFFLGKGKKQVYDQVLCIGNALQFFVEVGPVRFTKVEMHSADVYIHASLLAADPRAGPSLRMAIRPSGSAHLS
jgi:hypothetical protein